MRERGKAARVDESKRLHRILGPGKNERIQVPIRRPVEANELHIRLPRQRIEVRKIGKVRQVPHAELQDFSIAEAVVRVRAWPPRPGYPPQ